MEIAADKLLSLSMQQPHKIRQKLTTDMTAIILVLHLCNMVHIAGSGCPDAHKWKRTCHCYELITLK